MCTHIGWLGGWLGGWEGGAGGQGAAPGGHRSRPPTTTRPPPPPHTHTHTHLKLVLVRSQGKTLPQTLADALEEVPNPQLDPGIAQLNRIRGSLRLIAGNSSAVGLPQVRQ